MMVNYEVTLLNEKKAIVSTWHNNNTNMRRKNKNQTYASNKIKSKWTRSRQLNKDFSTNS
jgi:hypothetical protein